MNVMIALDEHQTAWLQEMASRTGKSPIEILRYLLELGQPIYQRQVDLMPQRARRPRLVK